MRYSGVSLYHFLYQLPEFAASVKNSQALIFLCLLHIQFSLRARFGTDMGSNALHCSSSVEEARSEIEALLPDFVFPKTSRKKTRKFVVVVAVKSITDETKGE